MAEYDVHDIERRLQAYDDRILRIDFNHRRGTHQIICWDPINHEEYISMSVPAGQLDARIEYKMMEINPKHYNAIEEINEWQATRDRHQENKMSDMARDMADTFWQPLLKDATGA